MLPKLIFPHKISILYFFLGISWIYLSDNILLWAVEGDSLQFLTLLQAFKGIIYVTTTACMLFLLTSYHDRQLKKSQKITSETAEKLHCMMESITDGFFTLDRNWKITHMNKVSEVILNMLKEEWTGQVIWDKFPAAVGGKSYNEYSKAMKENIPVNFEDYLPQTNSWYEVNAYPYKDGLTIYFRDISFRKEIQKEVLFNKNNLHALINNTPDLIWSIDKNRKLVSMNKPYIERMEHLAKKKMQTGDDFIFEGFGSYKTMGRWKDYIKRALDGEHFSVEEMAVKDERIQYFEVSFNPIYSDENEIIGIGCFARNISERKTLEEEKTSLIERLLIQNKELEEVSSIISHNLRAPVSNILSLTYLFNHHNLNDEINSTIINNLEKSAYRLDEVITDLSKIINIRQGINERNETVQLNEIIESVLEMHSTQIKAIDAIVHVDFTRAPQINSIKSFIHSIFINLISNAIKYSKPNTQPIISIESYVVPGHIVITVKDNGLGMNLSKHGKKIFSLYKRFHTHTLIEGKGLGLYLVKTQVEALNGKINVESIENEGTCFTIKFKISYLLKRSSKINNIANQNIINQS